MVWSLLLWLSCLTLALCIFRRLSRILWHHHKPVGTGTTITGAYGKNNLPEGVKPVVVEGEKGVCTCGALFILFGNRCMKRWVELENNEEVSK